MYSHCKLEQEILRSSHGPGVVALEREPPAPAPGREKGWAGEKLQANLWCWLRVYLLTDGN